MYLPRRSDSKAVTSCPVAACPSGRTPMVTLLRSLLQNQLMVPAVEGTRNVVRAAKDAGGVWRVVVTLSISPMVPSPGWPSGEVLDERCWTDIDYCEKNGVSLAYLPTPAAWVLPSQ